MGLIFTRTRPSGDYILYRYGNLYVTFQFVLYLGGDTPTGFRTRSGYGSGGAFVWQPKIEINQVIQRWVGGKTGTLGSGDNRFYDSSLDEKLGGERQLLGA